MKPSPSGRGKRPATRRGLGEGRQVFQFHDSSYLSFMKFRGSGPHPSAATTRRSHLLPAGEGNPTPSPAGRGKRPASGRGLGEGRQVFQFHDSSYLNFMHFMSGPHPSATTTRRSHLLPEGEGNSTPSFAGRGKRPASRRGLGEGRKNSRQWNENEVNCLTSRQFTPYRIDRAKRKTRGATAPRFAVAAPSDLRRENTKTATSRLAPAPP